MASTHFYYNPTAGTGNAQITVSASSQNTGQTEISATATFIAGQVTASVNYRHRYRPYFNQSSNTIPATGGSVTITAHSEYDIVFQNVPNWITITSNGITYQGDERISSGAANAVFTLTASANTGSSRGVYPMNMGHFIGNNVQSYVQYFMFTQEGGGAYTWSAVTMDVQLTSAPYQGTYEAIIDVESEDGNLESTAFTFTISRGGSVTAGTCDIPVKLMNDAAPLTVTVNVSKLDAPYLLTPEVNITLDYGTDSLYETGTTDEAIEFNTTYQGGSTMTISIDVENNL